MLKEALRVIGLGACSELAFTAVVARVYRAFLSGMAINPTRFRLIRQEMLTGHIGDFFRRSGLWIDAGMQWRG